LVLVVKVFGRDGESYQRYESDIKSYRDFTLAWYKVCWPWMALYSALLPCVALVMLPVGTLFVINGTSTLADLVLVFCLSLSIGVPLLKALSFAGKKRSTLSWLSAAAAPLTPPKPSLPEPSMTVISGTSTAVLHVLKKRSPSERF
jgi:hypothetical protein